MNLVLFTTPKMFVASNLPPIPCAAFLPNNKSHEHEMHAPNNLLFISHGAACSMAFLFGSLMGFVTIENPLFLFFPHTSILTVDVEQREKKSSNEFLVLIFSRVDDETQIKNHSSATEFITAKSQLLFISFNIYFEFTVGVGTFSIAAKSK